ncbi:serine/threonine-protein kinase [Nocardia callitridis]|uniref:serine/threonine-protein kinase n=1 Tax=Nocardia callitridis TaxID=648753 RepID=UPI0031EEF46E
MDTPGARTGTRFGPYELRALLGKGGMGEVYEAYDTGRDRLVAVKLLAAQLAKDPTYQLRFRRESQATARLANSHVIPINDWGVIDGALFIDMQLVRGTDLRGILRGDGALSPTRAVGIIEQVASALDAAHAGGLIHRDVKPGNILVTEDDYAYLADFGIAHTEGDSAVTMVGMAVGSYIYMAPERFDAGTVTGRADIYSLACVLHESLTGATPFPAASMNVLIKSHLSDPPPRPSVQRDGVAPALDEVIAKGMAKNPADRYASATELAQAARVAIGGAVTPQPPAQPTLVVRAPAQRTTAPGVVAAPTPGETSLNSVVNPAGPTVVRLTDFQFPPTAEQPAIPKPVPPANPSTGAMPTMRPFPDAHLFEQAQDKAHYPQVSRFSPEEAEVEQQAYREVSDYSDATAYFDPADAANPVSGHVDSVMEHRAEATHRSADSLEYSGVQRFSVEEAEVEQRAYRQVSDYSAPARYPEPEQPPRVQRFSPDEAEAEQRAYRQVSDYPAAAAYAEGADYVGAADDAAESAASEVDFDAGAPDSSVRESSVNGYPDPTEYPRVQRFSPDEAEAEQRAYRQVSDYSGVADYAPAPESTGGITEFLPKADERVRSEERAYSRAGGYSQIGSASGSPVLDEFDEPKTRKYPGVRAYSAVDEHDEESNRPYVTGPEAFVADHSPPGAPPEGESNATPMAYSEYSTPQAYSALDDEYADYADDDPAAPTEFIPVGDYRDPIAYDQDEDDGPAPRRGTDDSSAKTHSVVLPVLVAVLTMVVIAVAGVVGWQMFGSLDTSSNTAGAGTEEPAPQEPAAPGPASSAPPTGATTTKSKPPTLPAGAKECEPESGGQTTGTFVNVASGSSVTSCEFAEEVRKRYAEVGTADSISRDAPRSVVATSPVTGRTYTMKCETEKQVVTCNGGDNAIVYVY